MDNKEPGAPLCDESTLEFTLAKYTGLFILIYGSIVLVLSEMI